VDRGSDPREAKLSIDPHEAKLSKLIESVLSGPGMLDAEVRTAAARGTAVPETLGGYVQKVAGHAHKIADSDIDDPRRTAYTSERVGTISTTLFGSCCWSKFGSGESLRFGNTKGLPLPATDSSSNTPPIARLAC
jgi:hypothetical protein